MKVLVYHGPKKVSVDTVPDANQKTDGGSCDAHDHQYLRF
jgi:hypothetical protein